METVSVHTNFHVGKDGYNLSNDGKLVSSVDNARIFHSRWDAEEFAKANGMTHVMSVLYTVTEVPH